MPGVGFTLCYVKWGWVPLVFSNKGILALTLPKPSEGDAILWVSERWPEAELDPEALGGLKARLMSYFEGERVTFDDPVDWNGATGFQIAVWQATRAIPWGEVRSYGEIALAVGRPGGARAVGQALSVNPVPIIVPCHRVVRSDGTLGGFTGGIELKRRLLALEGVHTGDLRTAARIRPSAISEGRTG